MNFEFLLVLLFLNLNSHYCFTFMYKILLIIIVSIILRILIFKKAFFFSNVAVDESRETARISVVNRG